MKAITFLQQVRSRYDLGDSKKTERLAYLGAILIIYCFRSAPFLLNPQFWAEDGVIYFQSAWNEGFSSMLKPYAGYYCTISRLIALLASWGPVEYGPLIFALPSFILQALPLYLIFSDRTNTIFPKESLRFAFGFIYVASPGQFETFITATNLQWYLPVYIILLMFAEKPRNVVAQITEYIYLIICCISGPYVVFLFPLYAGLLILRKVELNWTIGGIMLLCFVIQITSLQSHGSSSYLDALRTMDWDRFTNFFSSKMVLNSWLGTNRPALIVNGAVNQFFLYLGLMIWLYATIRVLVSGNYFLMAVVFIGNANFITGYLKVGHLMDPDPFIGARYAMLGIIAYLYVYTYFLVMSKYRAERLVLGLLLVTSVTMAFRRDFRFFVPRGEDWRQHVKAYEFADEGETVLVKTNPPDYVANIIKKPGGRAPVLETDFDIDALGITSDTLRIRGWAIFRGVNAAKVTKEITLRSDDNEITFVPPVELRTDISAVYSGSYDSAGFQLAVPASALKPGEYSLSLRLSIRKHVKVIETGKKITR